MCYIMYNTLYVLKTSHYITHNIYHMCVKRHSVTCLTLSNCVRSGLPTLSPTGWSCVRSRLLTDVCDFTWQYEKCKGHKTGSKWKLAHFPLCPFLELMMQRSGPFCGFFPLYVRLAHFLPNKMAALRQRHNLNFINCRGCDITWLCAWLLV